MSLRSSVVAITPNGLPLAEVADFVNEKFLIKQNVNARTECEC